MSRSMSETSGLQLCSSSLGFQSSSKAKSMPIRWCPAKEALCSTVERVRNFSNTGNKVLKINFSVSSSIFWAKVLFWMNSFKNQTSSSLVSRRLEARSEFETNVSESDKSTEPSLDLFIGDADVMTVNGRA